MDRDTPGKDAPAISLGTLKRIIPRRLHPYLRGLKKAVTKQGYRPREPFSLIYAHTMASQPRQDSIYEKARSLVETGVPGCFVECGVLDGGTAAILGYAARNDPDRMLRLFDAWKGLPEITEEDGEASRAFVGMAVGSPRRVVSVLGKVGMPMERVVLHKGWFEETLPKATVDRIAFLHVDCDFYEPTKLVLETFGPRMVSGGWVQIDDYTEFRGARIAVDEFLADRPDIALVVEKRPGGAVYFQVP